MNAEQLSRVGEKLVKRCGSRDPFEIARQLGINVMLCENFGSLKGMYRVIKRNRFIFLNNSLDENMLRIVCATIRNKKRGASPGSSKVRYFKKLLLCSSACRL